MIAGSPCQCAERTANTIARDEVEILENAIAGGNVALRKLERAVIP